MKRYHGIFEKIKSIRKIGIYSLLALMMVVATPSSAFASTVFTSFQSTSATSYGAPGLMTMANGSFWYTEGTHAIGNMTTSGSAVADYDLTAGNPGMASLMLASITAGPDGNIWFVGSVSTSLAIGMLNTTTGAVSYYPHSSLLAGSSITNIVSASDGNLWFAAKGNGGAMDYTHFVKIDPSTGASTIASSVGYSVVVSSIASGPDGSLWYTDAALNRVQSFAVGGHGGGHFVALPQYSYPSQITAGSDGNMWLTENGKLAKVTMSGALTEYSLPTGVSVDGNAGLNPGTDGAIWFNASVNGTTSKVGRISLATAHVSTYSLPTGITHINGMLYGPDDALWFGTSNSSGGYLERLEISPDYTGAFQSTSATSYGTPGLMTMANGSFWYTENSTSHYHYIGNMTTSGSVVADYDLAASNPSMANLIVNSITTGVDGNIWFVGNVSTSLVVGMLNTTTGAVSYYSHPSSVSGSSISNIVSASDGNLWFTAKGNGGAMDSTYFVKVDPSTGASSIGGTVGYSVNVSSIASGPDGSLWYTDAALNRVQSFAVGGHGSGRLVLLPAYSYPSQLTAGSDGNMWLFENGKLAKVTMSGALTEYSLPAGISAGGSGLHTGTDGALWFEASTGTSSKIGRVSLATGHISTYSLPTGITHINGMLYGPDDALWFTTANSSTGYLERLGYY